MIPPKKCLYVAKIKSCMFLLIWRIIGWFCFWNFLGSASWKPFSLTCLPDPKWLFRIVFSSVQSSRSVVSDSLQPHEPQHARPPCPSPTPGVTQTHVHWVGDAIQPSHPLSSPSPSTLNLSPHWGLFKCVSSSQQVAKVLEFQLQHQSFQWTPRTDLL